MKRRIRVLCTMMAAVFMLSVCELALGDDLKVFLPERISKLNLPEMPEYITLKTDTDRTATYGDAEAPENPCPILQTEDAEIRLEFSKKPDWAGVTWMDGWENLVVDEEGRAVTTMEGHSVQPGIRATSGPISPDTGKPEWRWNDGGDYAYLAGLGPVTCEYGRRGTVKYVEYTVEQDYFKTGMNGAVTVIRWEPVSIKNTSEENYVKYETTTTVWFVSSVTASYPAGNPITKVKAEYRNDKKNTLSSYEITYALNENESYAITYMPNTTTIFEEHNYGLFLPDNSNLPSTIFYTNDPNTWEEYPSGAYWHHYTEDEPIYGEYTVNGVTYVSGSGSNLNKWYTAGHGTLLKRNGLRGVTSFPSPRVK